MLQVVRNRARKFGQSVCSVIKQKHQFPWAAGKKSWKVTQRLVDNYFKAMLLLPVLDHSYLYFNDKPLPFGKKRKRKIGNLYFS